MTIKGGDLTFFKYIKFSLILLKLKKLILLSKRESGVNLNLSHF